jgi:hypothetical protein
MAEHSDPPPSKKTAGWAPIPNWVIRDSDLSGNEILVLLALMTRTDETGECFPGTKLLAKESRTSETTVRRSLNTLAEKGFLTRRWRRDADGGLTSSVYTTHLERRVPEDERLPGGWTNGQPPVR